MEEKELILGAFESPIQEEERAGSEKEKNLLIIAGKLPRLPIYNVQGNQNRQQADVWFCTGYASAGVLANMFGWTQKQYYDFCDRLREYCVKKGQYSNPGGAYTANTAESAEELYNLENPTKKVRLEKMEINSTLFWTLVARNYTFAVTYISSKGYVVDANDGRLDGANFKDRTGGHCIRWQGYEKILTEVFGKPVGKPKDLLALDNYYKDKNKPDLGFKKYLISADSVKLQKQDAGGSYFPRCYTFIEEKYFDNK